MEEKKQESKKIFIILSFQFRTQIHVDTLSDTIYIGTAINVIQSFSSYYSHGIVYRYISL